MKNIIRSYIARLFSNKLFIGGNVLAFAITAWFTHMGRDLGLQQFPDSDFDFSLLAALGIPCFFSIFIPLFLGSEYQSGAIRNKVLTARSRKNIYFSALICVSLAMLVMTAAWLIGALFGARSIPSAEFVAVSTVKIILYNLANVSILVMLSMNISNIKTSAVIGILSFQTLSTLAVFINAMSFMARGIVLSILKALMNILPYGQWLCSTIMANENASYALTIQLILSAALLAVMTFIGTTMLQKKDIK